MTPNEVLGQNLVDTAVAPTAPVPQDNVPTGVESQSTELAELQRQEAEYDKYLNSVGGIEKAQATIEEVRARVASKEQAVNDHKWARNMNKELNHTPATENQSAEPLTAPTATPAYNQNMLDELNRNILKDIATEFEPIAESIKSGELVKDAQEFGLTVVKDGLLDRAAITKFADYVQTKKLANSSATPSSNPQVVSAFANYEPIPAGQMTRDIAMGIVLQSQNGEKHPEFDRAYKVFHSGIDS